MDEFSSAGAALDLQKQGYTKLYVLLGGFAAWKALNYPVTKAVSAFRLSGVR